MNDYFAIQALNWSTLKHMHESPMRCRHRQQHPRPDTDSLIVGRALHCRVLEPESFGARYAVCDVRRDARTKVYQEWLAAHSGMDALTVAEADMVEAMARAVEEHPVAAGLVKGGRFEATIRWDIEGLPCKARLDYLVSAGAGVVDLKSVETSRFAPRRFASEAAGRLYHGQLAWYYDGAVAAGVLPVTACFPWLVAVEKAPRGESRYWHDVAVYQLTTEDYDAGRALWRDLFARYRECVASGWWPGVAPAPLELKLPAWAPGMGGAEPAPILFDAEEAA